MAKLQETKGTVKLRGKIFNLQNERREAIFENDSIRKINFGIKTDDDNVHFVEVKQWQNNKRAWASWRDENKQIQTKEIKWQDRLNYKTGDKTVIGVRVKSNNEEEVLNLMGEDAIDHIKENFNDGDDVFVLCEMSFREYNNKLIQDKEIKSIFTTKDEINFEDEEFEELNDFEQQIVFDKAIADSTGTVKVFGRDISYKGDFVTAQFMVNGEENKELAKYLLKKCKFGDILKLVGKVHNRVTYKEVEQEAPSFVIGNVPDSYKQKTNSKVIDSERRELEILGITEHKPGIYKAEDFVKEQKAESASTSEDDDVPDFLK